MDPLWTLIGLLVGAPLGALGLLVASRLSGRRLTESARQRVGELLDDAKRRRDELLADAKRSAENNAKQIELEARDAAIKLREEAEDQVTQAERRQAEVDRLAAAREAKLERRSDSLDRKAEQLSDRELAVDERQRRLDEHEAELGEQSRDLQRDLAATRRQLVEISGLTEERAKEMLLARIEGECAQEAGEIVRKSVDAAREDSRRQGRQIVLEAIQRYAAEQTAEHTTTSIHLADDAMKGRVIGREGRNIRSFEKATGVDVIIDDTPGVVGLSCFDPVRREIARLSLEKLIADGRIHPGRIEEVVAEATDQMNEQLDDLGNQAAHNGHAMDLARPLLPMLGRLHFRTSYGQNVLKHSLEVAHLAQVMADELGLDGAIARRAGLLHDIGKAVDHETEGGHAEIGANLLRKHGEAEAVINAAAAHHGDVPSTTPYTPLVMAADAISASRPGARRESLERYVKRLKDLEHLAAEFKGVRQAYAIHAGREVRVIADAKALDDRAVAKLARDIAKKVEDSMAFPGEIKVTVLRETRSVELAR